MAYKDPERQKQAWREHYARNKQKYIDKALRNRARIRDYVREYKESLPCSDCGVSYPYYVMDFDHTADDKEFNIAQMHLVSGLNKVKTEMSKCDLVCSNCHRIRTHQRLITVV